MDFAYIASLILLIVGFGFVIFWHELGHFLAAKWAGVKVDQFAVGFGQAMICWRKGIGFTRGTSAKEYDRRAIEHLAKQKTAEPQSKEKVDFSYDQIESAAAELGLGETEYRLNWIPLGGYVKMLGQDDLDPNSQSTSPRAYNNKPILKRMVIVSAGVVMNLILAIIFFTILFRIGFDVPPPLVGSIAPGSPAQIAGVKVGDRVVSMDGEPQHDFTKLSMNVALLEEGQAVPLVVEGPDGIQRTLQITPRKAPGDDSGFLRLGLESSFELRGPDATKLPKDWNESKALMAPELFAIEPGDVVTAVNGEPVKNTRDFYLLDRALQASMGQPVMLTVKNHAGESRQVAVKPEFAPMTFSETQQLSFAGMVPRASIIQIVPDSAARGKLQPNDVILCLTLQPGNDPYPNPTPTVLREKLAVASKNGGTVDLQVLRDGKEMEFKGLSPQTRLETGQRGLGIGPDYDADHAVIGAVLDKSSAEHAKIAADATITSVDGQPIQSWYDVHRVLSQIKNPRSVAIVIHSGAGDATHDLELSQADVDTLGAMRYGAPLSLQAYSEPRKTSNPFIAARWGIDETRGMMTQFYLTLRRMVQGSVAPSNAMGPIGIFTQGSKIAQRGTDWLIWFLAMISANLAVVNFLPIPIVDGGLFVFLILEKIMGKPLSPRAQSIAQIVGLALIGGVFLFVTYHDISRMIF